MTNQNNKSVEPKKHIIAAKERIYDYVRRAILLGEYPGGTFIEEEEVSSKVGVSRTPDREAFSKLHADRYIELVPRKGALVRQVNFEELEGMYQARLMIEEKVVDIICKNRIPISPVIGETVEQMRKLQLTNTLEDKLNFIGLDWKFHVSIVELCGNDLIIDMYKTLRSRYDRVGMIVELSQEHLDKIHSEHIAVVGLLHSYDLEGLKKILFGHFHVNARAKN